jgi:putative flavoprotein involved in K+ transport
VRKPEQIQTVIIGAGQAGLSTGYFLARRGLPHVILEANQRVGDSWRRRWDSLRLFTPARFDGLAGMPYPAPPHAFPTKNEMADYLEAYASRFQLPVRTGVRVDRLSRQGDRYCVSAGDQAFEAEHVVVAMATFQRPKVPAFAAELDPGIVQLHSSAYRNLAQLAPGSVLVVGAGNSGSEIAMEAARAGRETWLAGRDVGHVPIRIEGSLGRLLLPLIFRIVFHRVLTVDTRVGRKARPKSVSQGGPLIRVKPKDLASVGVRRVGRVTAMRDGKPVLEGGQVIAPANVVWCTGYHPGLSWIDLPVFGPGGEPMQERGVVASEPGLYFVGLHFLYALSSTMIHGVERDARRVAETIASRIGASRQRVPASSSLEAGSAT